MPIKKIYLSILLFLLIFCILGLPFTNWGFRADDWGNIFHSIIHTLKDIGAFFTDGKSLDAFLCPSNATNVKPAFFCSLYRPMSLVYLIPQYMLFMTSPYGYFLVTIALHALSSVIIFHVFSLFTCLSGAFLGATLFGFHPSLHTWLGWISAQTYQIQLLALLLIILLLKLYLDKNNIWAYILACMLFLSNIFLHEQTFFLPFWLMIGIPIYTYKMAPGGSPQASLKASPGSARGNALDYIRKNLTLCLPFLGITIFYMLTRLHHFPLTSNTGILTFQPTWLSFKTRMAERGFDFVTFINDIFGLTALPKNHHFLKASLIILIFLTLVWLFIKTKQKLIACFLTCSIPLFGWPALLMHNQPRYYYLALPVFIALVLTLIPIKKISNRMQVLSALVVILFICVNATFLLRDLKRREFLYHPVTKAFELLASNKQIQNQSICFVGLPPEPHLFGACAQAIWLLRGNDNYPVFSITHKPIDQQYQTFNPVYVKWNNQTERFFILE